MTTTDYNQQAIDFLAATGTTFTAKFSRYDSMLWDSESESRDIFTCTLVNKQHRYRVTFGQSTASSTCNGANLPTAYDVLSCLTKYDPYRFEDFCSSYGYDTDSRAAYRIYKACMKEYHNLVKLFTPDQMELLQEIN